MTEKTDLLEILQEIEFITDINGCFFINAEDNSLIESTIPFNIRKEILWEICVLKDTFQQFSDEIKHGDLSELMLEGDKGYIFLFSIPPHLVLLAMASYETNISYLKLAMIDILKRVKVRIKELGDDVLAIPVKEFVDIEPARRAQIAIKPTKPIPVATEPAKPIKVVKPIPVVAEPAKPIRVVEPTPIATEPAEPIEVVEPIPVAAEPTPLVSIAKVSEAEEMNIETMIDSINSKELTDKYMVLKKIFDKLKNDIKTLTGVKISKILDLLKDSILNNIGTSLALFDLSRSSKDLSKNYESLQPDEINKLKNKIDNWSSRIIKL